MIRIMTLDELISELYALKRGIRAYGGQFRPGQQREKELLVKRKNELLITITKELKNIEKEKRDEICSKLWQELGVVL